MDVGPEADAYRSETNKLFCFGGTNDLARAHTPEATFKAFQTWLADRIAAGWRYDQIWILTPLPRGGFDPGVTEASFETARQEFIKLLVADAAAKSYHLIRLDLDAAIGSPGAYANRTYYSDRTHPNEAGEAVIAQIVKKAIGW